jgi:hypothetical protein
MAVQAVEFPTGAVDIAALYRAALTAERYPGGEEMNSLFNSAIAQVKALP